MKYLRDRRKQIFPFIDDFSKDQDHYKYKHPKDLSNGEWIWFHPVAYKIIRIGMFALPASLLLLLALSIANTWFKLAISAGIVYFLWKTINEYLNLKGSQASLYDVMIRDYKYEGDIDVRTGKKDK